MLKIDDKILTIDKVICRHIDSFPTNRRGIISQDILAQLRNFVEHIMLKFYAEGKDIDNNYDNICRAIKFSKSRADLKILRQFHDYLQIVASHYTLDEENSERLMLKYYELLLKLKGFVNRVLGLNILHNLSKFPLNLDPIFCEYYEKIAAKVDQYSANHNSIRKSRDKFYIQKIKPFFINEHIYYEVTFTPANDYASKFDRIIAFTKLDMSNNYAVKFSLEKSKIEIFNKTMPVIIIIGWEVAIRDCEFKNFAYLIKGTRLNIKYSEEQAICSFLTDTGFNLLDIIDLSDEEFNNVKVEIEYRAKELIFFRVLEICRRRIKQERAGGNLLRYLLYRMNNKVIKQQSYDKINTKLEGLYVSYGSIPFDRIPFNFSLVGHNPKIYDLLHCFNPEDRKHELLAHLIHNNTEIKRQLFTPVEDIANFGNIEELTSTYNSLLYPKHREESKLVIEKGFIFINGYKNDTIRIILQLQKLSTIGLKGYSAAITEWINNANTGIDCAEKKQSLIQMFERSRVALIQGSAGVGKSTLINHIAHFFANKQKLFLTQTNPAIDNLKRKVTASHCTFSTITKFLKSRDADPNCDLLVIDECSTVNNQDMERILRKANYTLLVLVGDSYQIAAIRFGNWFGAAPAFLPKTSIFELTKPYRTENKSLLLLWDKVRKMGDTISELITKQNYSASLDSSIFKFKAEDEIILCLNYDGLYGINNINRFLQENNPSNAVQWGMQQYKVNDPILFNNSERFSTVIYNNMKGRIVDVCILDRDKDNERILFEVEVERKLTGLDAMGQSFELVGNSDNGNSIIRFAVNKFRNADEDDTAHSDATVPFQVAYAVSIHKAQGLEYESVKVIITEEIEEQITHNIFYTAITRAKSELKIYWTPEVEKIVLNAIKPLNNHKEVSILKAMMGE